MISEADFGIWFSYFAMIALAVIPIYFGSYLAIENEFHKIESHKKQKVERLSRNDAYMFPVISSVALFSLYLVFKFIDKKYIDIVLSVYFGSISTVVLTATVGRILEIPKRNKFSKIFYKLSLFQNTKELFDLHVGANSLIALPVAIAIAASYLITKNWIPHNIVALALATSGIKLLALDSIVTGVCLLGALFFYDIFWVFGTDVMVSVAKNFDGPIKILLPRNIISLIKTGKSEFGMLGLGDIVIPGIFIALCLHYDYHRAGKNKVDPLYFKTCFAAYIAGLIVTIGVMHFFKAAQPALLYLSPACSLSVLAQAAWQKEFNQLWNYKIHEDKDLIKAVAAENKTE